MKKLLEKTWIRIVISLVAGGMATEIISISSGDPNRPANSADSYLTLVFAIIFYLLLSTLNSRNKSNS